MGRQNTAARQHLALAGEDRRAPTHAPQIILNGDMNAAEAFTAIVTACLAHYRSNEAVLIATRDPEALHQMRVALRRLRSAFWLFKPALKDARSRAIRHELRDFTDLLGAARDVDVCIARSSKGSKELHWLKGQRNRLYETTLKELRASTSRRFLFEIMTWAHSGDWRNSEGASSPLLPLAIERIDHLWRRILRFDPDPASLRRAERHRLRIDIKVVRYSLEFLKRALKPAKPERDEFGAECARLQRALGRLNDLATCRDLLASGSFKPKPRRASRRRHIRRARRSLRMLRKIGPFWKKVDQRVSRVP